MEAFEQVVAMLLHRQGYWVQTSYKVGLTKEDKKAIALPSSPRWEIDVVAYRPADNVVLAVECKSFLNSPGVSFLSFSGQNSRGATRYKLFTNPRLRQVVLARLATQLCDKKLALRRPRIQLCLAAAHIRNGHRDKIHSHCLQQGWQLFDSAWFAEQLADVHDWEYENDVAIVAAKLAAGALRKKGLES